MTTQWNKDETRNRVLTENTAQAVSKYLTDQESNRATWQNRWIWELLQNARDASKTSTNRLIVKIQYNSEELVFLHNGGGFTPEQITHLIYHGSTKVEDEETIGKYGSGFLTTHLLSPEVVISGQLHNGQWFDFPLVRKLRKPDSVTALRESMDEAWENFSPSIAPQVPMPEGFTTRFVYPIKEDNAANAVKSGIATLKQCAPYVVVFNQEFSSINIEDHHETICFEAIEPLQMEVSEIQQIIVTEKTNGNNTEMKYLLAQGEKASVTVPLTSSDNSLVCLPIENIPRLFLGFPLVGTEDFSFPAVIHSLDFTPTENRNGVYLWQSDNEANRNNQAVIEEACALLVRILAFVAKSGWCNVHRLVEIPPIQEKDWLKNIEQLRNCLKSKFIDEICPTPAVITAVGTLLAPQNAIFLQAKSEADIETLWKLLESLEEKREQLPKQDEAIGWCRAIQSWTNVSEHVRPMLRNGGSLASFVEEKSKYTQGHNAGWGHLENLQKLLRPDVCAVEWLNQFYQFLIDNGFDNEIRTRRFVPDQVGFFRQLNETSRDTDIDEDLKNVAELLGDFIRQRLRDTRLTPLVQEVGAGNMNNESVVSDIISRIRKRADEKPDDSFKEASGRLFAWIVNREAYFHLLNFPVFVEDGKSGSPLVFYLPNATHNTPFSSLLLAPVRAWPEDLQPFKDLFPPNSILADAFFEAASNRDTWQILSDQRLVNMAIRYRYTDKKQVNLKEFSPDVDRDEGTHIAFVDRVTDVVKRSEIMSRVSDSRERAFLFWRFLTEWLIQKDVHALEPREVICECGGTHKYYPEAWVMPVRNNSWILCEGKRRVRATAESLASLLRDNGWQPDSLHQNPAVVNLLDAIGVTRFDLMREFVTVGNEEARRVQENVLTEIIVKAGGNLSQISALVQDLKEDENLFQHLEERREQRRIVSENQHLGQQVEELVKTNLEKEGFSVRRTGTGSDFEISDNTDNMITLDIERDSKNWLVEVKSTRTQSVNMTLTQAKTAVGKGDEFLLCIVPIEQGNGEPDLETVREEMRFVKNIGLRVAPLCQNLNALEELQTNITSETLSGIKLLIKAGVARINVNHSVWETEGFPLENLAARLK